MHQLIITPGDTKYWIPQCDDALRPFKGQIFQRLDEAVVFYTTYASRVGFDLGHSKLVKAVNKTVVWKYLVCSREGNKHHADTVRAIHPRRRRVSNRVGIIPGSCFESMDQTTTLFGFFEENHNHPMKPDECRARLKINRTMTAAHQTFFLNCIKANIGPIKSYKLYKEMVGGYSNIGTTKVEFRNFKRELMGYILGADTQLVIDKFYKHQENNPVFYFRYELDEHECLHRLFWVDTISRHLNIEVIPPAHIRSRWTKFTFSKPMFHVDNISEEYAKINDKKILMNKIWSDVHICVGYVETRMGQLDEFSKLIGEHKRMLMVERGGGVSAMVERERDLNLLLGCLPHKIYASNLRHNRKTKGAEKG
ncbi:Unknown protein [Striga hermonthica]|uniref:FAR1 domain-containing protein n=1 Tax=Striga hermonthica TaxID=68872 RepID=A0A9N7N5W6_STRHE|nr:Unknown protein [Striga hermonthica]